MARKDSIAAIAAQTKARQADASAKPAKAHPFAPTPEQQRHADYVEQNILDVGSKGRLSIGKAHRLQPRFEKIEGLGTEQLEALRFYRAAFDASEQSEVKSCLDVRPQGQRGSHGAIVALEARAFGAHTLRHIESALGGAVTTLRAIALHDLTFSEAAMQRFGSREVDWIDVGKGKRKPRSLIKLAPKSGRHREIVRDEFFAGLAALVKTVRPYRKGGRK